MVNDRLPDVAELRRREEQQRLAQNDGHPVLLRDRQILLQAFGERLHESVEGGGGDDGGGHLGEAGEEAKDGLDCEPFFRFQGVFQLDEQPFQDVVGQIDRQGYGRCRFLLFGRWLVFCGSGVAIGLLHFHVVPILDGFGR